MRTVSLIALLLLSPVSVYSSQNVPGQPAVINFSLLSRACEERGRNRTMCNSLQLQRGPLLLRLPGQTDSQVDASQHKFAKPELVYGLAKGGQTDLQVTRSLCFYNNRWLALSGQMVKNLHLLASKFELNQSQRKLSQVDAVDASGWPNKTQVEPCESVCAGL